MNDLNTWEKMMAGSVLSKKILQERFGVRLSMGGLRGIVAD